ncbi:hypothetical protein F511_42092 [Dorcoceras hygrometricum]|uniref:Uncharacterized protein n=1 Tax=Dorcoceras hygrometricum TaxID=472368 RepID=A0A2Z7BI37_9LAMI|nr:hypothetical protein F511_42092 [Dorcoceras hygrometricum]
MLISSALLVQPDEGVSVLVVDWIGDYLPQYTKKSRVLVIPVGARHKCQQDRKQNREASRRAAALRGGDHHIARALWRARHHRLLAARLMHCGLTNARTLLAASLDAPGVNLCAAGRASRGTLGAASREGGRPLLLRCSSAGRRIPLLADDDYASVGHRRALLAGRCRSRVAPLHAWWCARPCALAALVIFMAAPAGRRSGDAPASLRRSRDDWSEFF